MKTSTTRRLAAIALAALSVGLLGAHQETPPRQAEISGIVTTASEPRTPLARALVTISGSSLKPSRTVITDDQGRFTFGSLPSGSFVLVAMRPPYVKTTFGAKRPARPGTPINLAAGQHVSGITIPLPRGAAITGVIRDAGGEVAPGVRVEVTSFDPQASAALPAVTDDRGVYRIFGLPPGRYLVSAAASDVASAQLTQFTDAEMDAILAGLARRSSGAATTGPAASARGAQVPQSPAARPATYGYAPIYFPGTPDPEQAETLVLLEAEERGGIDIGLRLVRTASIDGRVSSATGPLPSNIQVTITRLGTPDRAANNVISSANTRRPDATGALRFPGVLPGRYRLVARAFIAAPAPPTAPGAGAGAASSSPAALTLGGVFWAMADVTVAADDVTDVELVLRPGLHLSGRVVFDRHSLAAPNDLSTIRLRPVEVNGVSAFSPFATIRSDGTFDVNGILPGRYGMTATLPETGWWLRSVVVDGRDILDLPVEIGASGDVSGAVATFTDQHTELSGALQSAPNIPASEYFVVVFPPDPALWRPAARRVQSTRPGTDGRFSFRDLPDGDYLIAALTDLEPTDLFDASFMERLIPAAVHVHVSDGEKKVQDLRVIK